MKNTFAKGQQVTILQNWSVNVTAQDGQYVIRLVSALVHSAGNKRMVLTDMDGNKFIGQEFQPTVEQYDRYRTTVERLVFPTGVTEEVIAQAKQFGEIQRKRSIDWYVNQGFTSIMLDALNASTVTIQVVS